MKHDRGRLTQGQVFAFIEWCKENHVSTRPGKGNFQLLQIFEEGKWHAVCQDAKGVVSTPPCIRAHLKAFSLGKSFASTIPVRNYVKITSLADVAHAFKPSPAEAIAAEQFFQTQKKLCTDVPTNASSSTQPPKKVEDLSDLRDDFAITAMKVALEKRIAFSNKFTAEDQARAVVDVARFSYQLADAMLEARKVVHKPKEA